MNLHTSSKHAANYVSVLTLESWCVGAFISQWQRWRGVFAPARANENKTIHRFFKELPSLEVTRVDE